ncbi:unnamed protein product [Coregonus sp. 'balchen']|nr:unnamed protein product [Coregonus sp. 'balchen']
MTLDDSVRFNFPINITNACGSLFRTTSAPGTGIFSDFSNVQTANISGVVRSHNSTTRDANYTSPMVTQITTIRENGESHHSRFSFQAFCFIKQQNEMKSTYFLCCITRLCEKSICSMFMQCNNRRRSTQDMGTEHKTITSPFLTIRAEIIVPSKDQSSSSNNSGSSTGLGVAVGILAFACIIADAIAAIFYRRLNH